MQCRAVVHAATMVKQVQHTIWPEISSTVGTRHESMRDMAREIHPDIGIQQSKIYSALYVHQARFTVHTQRIPWPTVFMN